MFRTLALALLLVLLPSATASAKKLDGNAVISFAGVGPIKLKMGINEARKAAHRGIVEGREVTKG